MRLQGVEYQSRPVVPFSLVSFFRGEKGYTTTSFVLYENIIFHRASILLNLFGFDPEIILALLLSAKVEASHENQKNIISDVC